MINALWNISAFVGAWFMAALFVGALWVLMQELSGR